MNETKLRQLADQIRDRLKQLDAQDALGRDSQSVVTLDQQSVGRLSRMDALQNQAMAQAQQDRRNVEKRRLAAALRRMADGEYGFCDNCGEDIPHRRLELDPAATLCVSCASG